MKEALKKYNIVSTICMTVFAVLCIIPGAMYFKSVTGGKVFSNSFGYGTFFVPVKAIKYIFTNEILMLLVLILAILCSMVYFMKYQKEKFHQKIWSYLPILILVLYIKEMMEKISEYSHLGFVFWIQVLLLVLVFIIQFYSEKILEK